MPRYANVPGPTIRRLSLYLRQLESFWAAGHTTISSQRLGKALRVTDAQVRKDLAYFGQFGRPGLGYRVDELIGRARLILGTNQLWATALVGAGNLGRALAAYRGSPAGGSASPRYLTRTRAWRDTHSRSPTACSFAPCRNCRPS